MHSAASVVLAAHQGRQGPDQAVDVNAVGLGPARPAVDHEAGAVEHMVVDAVGAQDAVQPEAVVARLVAADHPDWLPERRLGPVAGVPDQLEQGGGIAACDGVMADPIRERSAEGDHPGGLRQFQRDQKGGVRGRDARGAGD